MGKEMYQVQIGGETRLYEEDTTYKTIAEEYQKEYKDDIVLVFVDGKLQELFKPLKKNCSIRFETTTGVIGHRTYQRSMSLLLVKAIYDVAGHDSVDKVISLPPPWTMMGLKPTSFKSTTSWMT